MLNTTPNLGLIKPLVTEQYDIAKVTNENADILDSEIKAVKDDVLDKQDILVSGTNIKTINGNSVLGSGDLIIAHNQIINGNFQVNQRANSGTVVLTAGQYGHDRWKAGASGCTYTFSTVENITTITISSGSLIQVVDGLNLETGTYCLSWEGTSQGKIGGGSYGASGITGSVVGSTNLNIEFNTGTLKKVSLVKGGLPSTFVVQPYADVLRECQRYYVKYRSDVAYGLLNAFGYFTTSTTADLNITFSVPLRVKPTTATSEFANLALLDSGVAFRGVVSATISSSNEYGAIITCTSTSLTPFKATSLINNNDVNGYLAFSAEL